MEIFFIISYSYLSGSVPFGLLLTKIFINKDVRNIGSGNIGATNVLRTGNKFLATTTLILDCFKGFVPVAITQEFFPEYTQLSALIVFLGHVFPFWLKFKGGKGVSTYLGILFALSLYLAVLFIFTWVAVLLIFRYSSVSSIFSSLTVFVVTFLRVKVIKSIDPTINILPDITIILFIFFILILFTHKKNISNLKNKKEIKIKI